MLYIIDLKGNLHNKIPNEVIKDLNIVFVSSIEYLLELNCTNQNDYIYFNIESDLKLNKRMIPKGIVLGNLKNVNFKEIIDLEGDKLGLSKLYIFMKKNFIPGSVIGEFKDIKHNCLIKLSIDSGNIIEKKQEQVLKVKNEKPVEVEQELNSKKENIDKPKKQKYSKEEREAYRKKKAEEFEKRKKERELKAKTKIPIIPDVNSELKIQDADSSLIKTEKKEDESVQIKEDLNIKEKLPSFLEKTKSNEVHTEVEKVEKKSKVEDIFEVEDIEDTNPSKIVEGLTVEDVDNITVENFDEPKPEIPTFEIEDIDNNSNNSFEIEDVNENPIIKKMLN